MGIFGMFKGKTKEAVNQFSGNKDFMEGIAAAAALVAGADGVIDDAEFDKTLAVMKANSALSAAFSAQEMESTFGRMAPKTATRSGRAELKEEIRQVLERDKTGKMGNAMMLCAIDVADEGGIDDKEAAILKDLCAICGVNYDKLLAG